MKEKLTDENRDVRGEIIYFAVYVAFKNAAFLYAYSTIGVGVYKGRV